METKQIQLHLGTCIEDLDYMFNVLDLKQKKAKLLCNSALKLFEKAEKARLKGDEETSYVFFMKYLKVVAFLSRDPEYNKEKKFFNQLLGVKNPEKAISMAEVLKKSLIERYAEHKHRKRIEEIRKNMNNKSNDVEINNGTENNIPQTHIIVDDGLPSTDDFTMKCSDLFKFLREGKYEVMILDVRTAADYDCSHINHPNCISVPEHLIAAGKSANTLEQDLPESSKVVWRKRQMMDLIVMVDWSSRTVIPGKPLYLLRTILLKWDVKVQYKRAPVALEGGFEEWLLLYPSFTTNPQVSPPMDTDLVADLLDEINYPSWTELSPMTVNSPINLTTGSSVVAFSYDNNPKIDRTSKAAAIQTYEERSRLMQGLLEQQEKLADTSLNIEMQRIQAEQDWKEIWDQTAAEGTEDSSKQSIELREQEIRSQLMLLENKQHDMELENQNLREQLEEYQRREKEENERSQNNTQAMDVSESSITESEGNMEQLAASKKRIVEAMKRKETLHRQREHMEAQRLQKLTFARQMKKPCYEKREQEDDEDEDSENRDPSGVSNMNRSQSSPNVNQLDESEEERVPKFDRTTKPVVVERSVVERDFEPVFGAVGRGLTGLKNLGNTCYMNSIIQCLNNTSILSTYFCNGKYREHLNRTQQGTRGVIAEELAAVVRTLWSGQYKYITTKDFRYAVGKFQSTFRGYEQQDSHEFLTILMDWLHNDLQFSIKTPNQENLHPSDKAWLDFTKGRESLILRLFYGQIKSTVRCTVCGETSVTYDTFSNLSLELPPNANRCSLYDCLRLYLQGERVPGWDCPRCKEKRDAVKKLDISRLPPVLVVHFKRFYADAEDYGSVYRKKQTYIDFPLDNLELSSIVLDKNRPSYSLYAVSNHYGSMQAGHYTAYCESAIYGKWYKFDDHSVTEISPSEVKSSAAYLLFYTTQHGQPT